MWLLGAGSFLVPLVLWWGFLILPALPPSVAHRLYLLGQEWNVISHRPLLRNSSRPLYCINARFSQQYLCFSSTPRNGRSFPGSWGAGGVSCPSPWWIKTHYLREWSRKWARLSPKSVLGVWRALQSPALLPVFLMSVW